MLNIVRFYFLTKYTNQSMGLIRFDKISRLFGIIVVLLILVFGAVVLFSNYFTYLPSNYRKIVGLLIILYGAFRFVAVFSKLKNEDDE
jgi:hypothetical protein